jgi:RNA polymerase sigma factor (sigma-70 family)
MPDPDDHQLLAEFVRTESEPAFAALVSRYVHLVYSTALRFTDNAHYAEEITQAVFIILARKAGGLSPRVVLSGWLYQATRLTAANFMKGEIRRQRREQEAYMQSALNDPNTAAWQAIAPLLDEAMGRFGTADRDAVVLRFFQNKTAAEMAAELKLSEAAAHKRLARALEKLRTFFRKRGVSSTAAIIAGALTANSVHAAPSSLANSVAALAVAKGATASTSTLTLIKGALKIMAWTKAKIAVITGVTILLAAGTTTVALQEFAFPASYLRIEGKGKIESMPGQPRLVETADFVILTDGNKYRISIVSKGYSGFTNDAYDITADYSSDGQDFFVLTDRMSPIHRTPGGFSGFAYSGRMPSADEVPSEPVYAAWLAYCSDGFFNAPANRTGLRLGEGSMIWPDFVTNQPTFWPGSSLPENITGWSRNWIIKQRSSSLEPIQAIELKQYPNGFKAWQFTAEDPIMLLDRQIPRKAVRETFFPNPPKTATTGDETLLLSRATFTADSIKVVKGRLDPLPPVPVSDLEVLDWRFKDVSWNYVITSHATPAGWPTRGSKAFKQAAQKAAKLAAANPRFIEEERKKQPVLIPPK